MDLKKQNILFITRAPIQGGTENVILQLCEILYNNVNKIVVCAGVGFNKKRLEELGIKFYDIPDIERKTPVILFQVCKIIQNIIDTEDITVIHTHHRMAAFYVSLLKLYKKCVFINTSHNTFYNKKFLTQFSYKHGYLIACGEMVKKNLIQEFGLSDKQVTVIHNAVKPFDGNIIVDTLVKKFHNEGNFVIGNIGRLSKQKGMEFFIYAIPEVIKKQSNTRFIIVGNGEDEEKLKKLSKNLGLNDYLYFLGYRNDIQNLMSQLDLIVLSSLWEGLPLIPIEAFSVKKTIVATDVDGTPEIVKNMDNGLLVEPGNSKEIANAILWMIENKDMKNKMELNAKKTFDDQFSEITFSNSIINYYRSI